MKKISSKSDEIIQRIKDAHGTYLANENISKYLKPDEIDKLLPEVQAKVEQLLKSLIIDTDRDPHTQETSHRIAKMLLFEVMKGRYQNAPKIKSFDNDGKYHDLILLGPIKVRSMCSHHFVPVIGTLYLGVISNKSIWGISKFSRICNWFLARPHIQEKATQDLANLIDELLQPQGLIIKLTAKHFCMSWRGVHEEHFQMTTVAKKGLFERLDYENKFFNLLAIKSGEE